MSVSPYRETLGSLLYPGFQHSLGCLKPLVLLSEQVLPLKIHQVPHVGWRLDGGFGSDDALNWLLPRCYQVLAKGYNSRRAQKVVQQVPADDWQTVRSHKWVASVPTRVHYARRMHTLALSWITESGLERSALLLHTLQDWPIMNVLALYDARGGTIENDAHQDKLGLQLIRRRKRRWHAQEAWVILTDIAHNLLIWSHDWMFADSPFASFGMLRLVQDVFNIPGHLTFDPRGRLQKVDLLRSHPFAAEMMLCLERLFKNLS